jgi:hypothetical protein
VAISAFMRKGPRIHSRAFSQRVFFGLDASG